VVRSCVVRLLTGAELSGEVAEFCIAVNWLYFIIIS